MDMKDAQGNDALSQNFKEVLKKDGLLTAREIGLLCKKALTDGEIQDVVSGQYRRTLLHHRHCTTLAENSEKTGMYDIFNKTYYWPHMASDVHEFVIKCK